MDLFTKRCGCGTIINVKTACCDSCFAKRRAEAVALAGPKQSSFEQVFQKVLQKVTVDREYATWLKQHSESRPEYDSKQKSDATFIGPCVLFNKAIDYREAYPKHLNIETARGVSQHSAFEQLFKPGDVHIVSQTDYGAFVYMDERLYQAPVESTETSNSCGTVYKYKSVARLVAADVFNVAYEDVSDEQFVYVQSAKNKNDKIAKIFIKIYYDQLRVIRNDLKALTPVFYGSLIVAGIIYNVCRLIAEDPCPELAVTHTAVFLRDAVKEDKERRSHVKRLQNTYAEVERCEKQLVKYIQNALRS